MRFATLALWLDWQQTLHPKRIDPSLERVGAVWARLWPEPFPMPVITVGGTNGKGSCVTTLEACYLAAGYRCGAYRSPHLLRYNERVFLLGQEASDAQLCAAFARIDAARGAISLTYFEFGTLAALELFARAGLDVALLEVGMGGRLDATNLLDADVALITNIGHDHQEWLGAYPDGIATEKAGIFRPGRPAILGQRDAPPRLRACAEALGARPLQLGREFDWQLASDGASWRWSGPDGRTIAALPLPVLTGRHQLDNAAAALAALDCLQVRLPVAEAHLRAGLRAVRLPGRFQVLPGPVTWILDVAHNAEAATVLAENLRAHLADLPQQATVHTVCAMLADKDATAMLAALAPLVDHWHLAAAPDPRALSIEHLLAAATATGVCRAVRAHATLAEALEAVARAATTGDQVLVTGSFVTVEAALRKLAPPSV